VAAAQAWTRRDALASLPFWTVSGPFALALLAQVAFIVHQIAFMEPLTGRATAAFSVSVMTMMAVLRNYDQRLDLAAQSLGAGPIATLRHVTFPILGAGMMSSFLFAFATSFDELTIALFSSGGLSATLPKQFWDEVTLQVSPVIAAVSTCLFVFIAALIFIAELLRRRAAAR